MFTAIECASSTFRLRMPSSNSLETMSVQHYSEKGPAGVGIWQLATSRKWCSNRDKFGLILLPEQYITPGVWKWQWCHYKDQSRRRWCRKLSYKTTNQDGNDAARRPTRQRIELGVKPQIVLRARRRFQLTMMPKVALWDNKSSRQSSRSKAGMMPQERLCMVSYCFHSSIIPQECGSGNDATLRINQDGDDVASRPTRRRFKMATMPQVVLPDYKLSLQWCRKSSNEMMIQVGNDAASRPMRRRIEPAIKPQ
jgi:hypothetical protein